MTLSKTIFVIDDSDFNLAKAKLALDSQYRVFTLSSAAKMFSLIEKIMPNLILLDIEMPEMNGLVALKKLKDDPKTANIPVILATVDEAARAQGLKLGAIDCTTKPFSEQILQDCVTKHLEANS